MPALAGRRSCFPGGSAEQPWLPVNLLVEMVFLLRWYSGLHMAGDDRPTASVSVCLYFVSGGFMGSAEREGD